MINKKRHDFSHFFMCVFIDWLVDWSFCEFNLEIKHRPCMYKESTLPPNHPITCFVTESIFPSQRWVSYVAHVNLNFRIFLPIPVKCNKYRPILPCQRVILFNDISENDVKLFFMLNIAYLKTFPFSNCLPNSSLKCYIIAMYVPGIDLLLFINYCLFLFLLRIFAFLPPMKIHT